MMLSPRLQELADWAVVGLVALLLAGCVALCGCSIQSFNRPPRWSSAVTSHERFFGLNASIPVGGGAMVGVKLGWGSVAWSVIPCATNEVHAAAVSDTFSLGQGINPFSTKIDEDLQSGWTGTPPLPRCPSMFAPAK